MENISSHVLDSSSGSPAKGLHLLLFISSSSASTSTDYIEYEWGSPVATTMTDNNGRAMFPYKSGSVGECGVYKLVFLTQKYFQATGTPTFYPQAEIIFRLSEPSVHHHIPLILSPFGYSTYKGS